MRLSLLSSEIITLAGNDKRRTTGSSIMKSFSGTVGLGEGIGDGSGVGEDVGLGVGDLLGEDVGLGVGDLLVGAAVGATVGGISAGSMQ